MFKSLRFNTSILANTKRLLFLLTISLFIDAQAAIELQVGEGRSYDLLDSLQILHSDLEWKGPVAVNDAKFEAHTGPLTPQGLLIARIDLKSATNQTEVFVVEFGNTKSEKIEAFLLQNGKVIWAAKTGSMVDRDKRQLSNRFPAFVLSLNQEPATFLFHFSSGSVTRFQLTSISEFNRQQEKLGLLQGGFLAILIAIAFYWSIVYRTTGIPYQGIYVLHLLSYAMYTVVYEGFFMLYSEVQFSEDSLQLLTDLSLITTLIFFVEFCRRFMELNIRVPNLNRFYLLCIAMLFLIIPLSLTHQSPDHLVDILALFMTIMVLVSSILLAYFGSQPAVYLMISVIPMSIAVFGSEVLHIFEIDLFGDNNLTTLYIYYLGSSLQVLFLAFGLAALISKERVEREIAQKTALARLEETSLLKESYNQDLENEINEKTTEIQQQNLTLQKQKHELEQLGQMKTRFFAAASHDLRQPLHAMGLFAESLKRHVVKNDGKGILEKLMHSLESMTHLFNSLLDVTRLDAAVIKPDRSAVSVRKIMCGLGDEFKQQALAKGLTFRVRLRDDFVDTDEALLTRILRNLLSNAIRYTERGGILLACRISDRKVLIQVYDTGVGMTTNQLDRAFDEFSQVQVISEGGIGLGLSIVKRMASLLDHELITRSVVDKGTMVGILMNSVQSVRHVDSEDDKPQSMSTSVWVVDDDEMVLSAMSTILSQWGCQVHTFSSAAPVLLQIDSTQLPELLICDADLGQGQSGIELLIELQEKFPKLISAIITGDTGKEKLTLANKFKLPLLHKPINAAQLRSLVLFATRPKKITKSTVL